MMTETSMYTGDIDFVIPWVDGSDPEWRARKSRTTGGTLSDEGDNRYRDWDLLRYWFRGVEKFTPWVRKIWFICDQRPPLWLNTEHPKLHILRHEDYLPEDYRPAFSANPIELNIHRIPELSERFVYFNDDTFLLRSMKKECFFKNGLPCDCALFSPIPTTELAKNGRDAHIFTLFLNDTEYLNCDYNFRACLKAHPWKWINPVYGKQLLRNLALLPWPRFVGFVEEHLPNAYLKSSFEKAWTQDFDILDATSRHHIRDDRDVNQWLIRYQQLAEGRFVPRKPRMYCAFNINDDNDRMHRMICKQGADMICLNDTMKIDLARFEYLKDRVKSDFDCILSAPSEYELL